MMNAICAVVCEFERRIEKHGENTFERHTHTHTEANSLASKANYGNSFNSVYFRIENREFRCVYSSFTKNKKSE